MRLMTVLLIIFLAPGPLAGAEGDGSVRELIANGGFEQQVRNWKDWKSGRWEDWGGGPERSRAQARTGTFSVPEHKDDAGHGLHVQQIPPAGTRLRLEAWFRLAAADDKVSLNLTCKDADDRELLKRRGEPDRSEDGWTRHSLEATVPEGVASMHIGIWRHKAADTVYVDDVSLVIVGGREPWLSLSAYRGSAATPEIRDSLQVGTPTNIDRQEHWSVVPDALAALPFLLTARDDKKQAHDPRIYTVELGLACTVYAICETSRPGRVPPWLGEGWQASGMRLESVRPRVRWSVYHRRFEAGPAELGNQHANTDGGEQNVCYVFRPEPGQEDEPPPAASPERHEPPAPSPEAAEEVSDAAATPQPIDQPIVVVTPFYLQPLFMIGLALVVVTTVVVVVVGMARKDARALDRLADDHLARRSPSQGGAIRQGSDRRPGRGTASSQSRARRRARGSDR